MRFLENSTEGEDFYFAVVRKLCFTVSMYGGKPPGFFGLSFMFDIATFVYVTLSPEATADTGQT